MQLHRSQRKYGTLTYQESSTQTMRIPTDSFIEYIDILIFGTVTTTFGSGTPVSAPTAFLDIMIPAITVRANNRTVKSIRPYMMRMYNTLCMGITPRRAASAGAAAAPITDNVTADARWAWGTTGQYTSALESIQIPFAVPRKIAENGLSTLLKTKGLSNAELVFDMGAMAPLNTETDQASVVVYTNKNFTIDVIASEIDLPEGTPTMDFTQTTYTDQIPSQATLRQLQLSRGNILLGFGMLVETNTGGTDSVDVKNNLSNTGVTAFGLQVNGNTYPLDPATRFSQKQNEMFKRFGISAAFTTNVSQLDGYTYVDFVSDRNINAGLDLRLANSIYLLFTTAAARAAAPFLTYPFKVTVDVHEVRTIA
jgi:hypothetical protein